MVGLRFTTVQCHYSANKPYCITVLPRFSDTIFFQYTGTIVSLRNLIHHIRFTRITIFLNENLAATALFFFSTDLSLSLHYTDPEFQFHPRFIPVTTRMVREQYRALATPADRTTHHGYGVVYARRVSNVTVIRRRIG